MNGMNINEFERECALCMDKLSGKDINFFRFCLPKIITSENERCPGGCQSNLGNPDNFIPFDFKQIALLEPKDIQQQENQQKQKKIIRNLANIKVIQKNLIFLEGLPQRFSNTDILKSSKYFGKFGRIQKATITPNTTYAGLQGPTVSAYLTYFDKIDALTAVKSLQNMLLDGHQFKAHLGCTKYCGSFIKNQQCAKPECSYLHELGDPKASFTKEQIYQKKHLKYENSLLDSLVKPSGTLAANEATKATKNNLNHNSELIKNFKELCNIKTEDKDQKENNDCKKDETSNVKPHNTKKNEKKNEKQRCGKKTEKSLKSNNGKEISGKGSNKKNKETGSPKKNKKANQNLNCDLQRKPQPLAINGQVCQINKIKIKELENVNFDDIGSKAVSAKSVGENNVRASPRSSFAFASIAPLSNCSGPSSSENFTIPALSSEKPGSSSQFGSR